MTDYSELLDDERVKRGRFSRKQVDDCLAIARRDLATAEDVLEKSPEWAFNIAYNAMHQAGRALMFDRGYRSVGEGHHATVIRFLELTLSPAQQDLFDLMDRMRRKRNRATYGTVGTISRPVAAEAITSARELVAEVVRNVRSPEG